MREKNYKEIVVSTTLKEIKGGAGRYISSILKELEKLDKKARIEEIAAEVMYMAYGLGVIAGKLSDMGVEGFTVALNGIKMSIDGEDRSEEINFAVWDKEGNLHTSEDGFKMEKGGEK